MWILILMALAGSYHGGSAIDHVEFSSRVACEKAADAYVDAASKSDKSPDTRIVAKCVEK